MSSRSTKGLALPVLASNIGLDGLAVPHAVEIRKGDINVSVGGVASGACIKGPFADSAAARAGGVPIGSLYYVGVTGVIGVALAP